MTTRSSRPQPAPDAGERPKRLSLSQILEMMLARSGGERSAVTLTRNARGETQLDVTVRTGDDSDIRTALDAEKRAREIYDRLASSYPSPSSHEDAEVTLTRNAKGETQIAVSAKTTEAHPTLDALTDETLKVYEAARMRYPMNDGRSAAEGSVA